VTKRGEEDEFPVVAQTTRKKPSSDCTTLPTEALDIGSEPGFVYLAIYSDDGMEVVEEIGGVRKLVHPESSADMMYRDDDGTGTDNGGGGKRRRKNDGVGRTGCRVTKKVLSPSQTTPSITSSAPRRCTGSTAFPDSSSRSNTS